MTILKVKDRQDLVRESNSNAILNVDKQSLNKYKEEREFKLKMQKTTQDIDQLKVDIQEIKQLIRQLCSQG